jgi:hypothetical protein
MREDGTMKATKWRQTAPMAGHRISKTAVLLAASLATARCSTLPRENSAQRPPPANYAVLLSNVLKNFKGFSGYNNFAISGLRWVHATSGWNWLVCVRYDDHGRQLYYAFFLNDNAIVAQRYDVRTDQCRAQQYLPFNVATGTIEAPAAFGQPAPETGGVPTMPRGPIY